MIRRFISECYTCFDITSGVLSLVYFHTDSARRMTNSYYRPQTKFAKIMFLHLSVSHSVHRGGGVPGQVHPPGTYLPPLGRHTPWAHTLPPGRYTPGQVHPTGRYTPRAGTPPGQAVHAGIRSTSGRYASHWNAFLFKVNAYPF